MAEGLEYIGKKSVAMSYAAVFFSLGAGVILLPFILRSLSSETVAIWNILQTIYALIVLLDFGFRPSFARNLSYIFSGIKKFQVEGVDNVNDTSVDYGLLKSTLKAMRKFYTMVTAIAFILLATVGTVYFLYLLDRYHGDRTDAIVSWILFCLINCYNIYTLFYDALLTGKGYITKLQQITILGQLIYLSVAILLLYMGYGLSSVVLAQLLSIVTKRILAHKVFFTANLKQKISVAQEGNPNEILRVLMPNAVKIGITQISSFVINKSAMLIGSLSLTLADIAMYGVSAQVIDILARCGTILYATYSPQLAQYRAEKNIFLLKKKYIMCVLALVVFYIVGGASLAILGNPILNLIGSNTSLLPSLTLIIFIVVSFLEQNHVIAAGFIQADNRIPFFIPSIISGVATVIMLWIMLDIMHIGVIGLILAPGIVQLAYQNWKWPSVIIKEFKIVQK